MKRQIITSLIVIALINLLLIGCDNSKMKQVSGISGDDVSIEDTSVVSNEEEADATIQYAMVGKQVNMRSEATTDDNKTIICQLHVGDTVKIVVDSLADDWCQVQCKDTIGFVKSSFLEPLTADSALVETAPIDSIETDTVVIDATQSTDSLQYAVIDSVDLDSLWRLMIVGVDVLNDTTQVKLEELNVDSLFALATAERLDSVVLNQLIKTYQPTSKAQTSAGVACWVVWLVGALALLFGIILTCVTIFAFKAIRCKLKGSKNKPNKVDLEMREATGPESNDPFMRKIIIQNK